MSGLALVAECSKRAGAGHAVETAHLAARLKGVRWRAFLTRGTPDALFGRFGGRAERIPDLSRRSLEAVARRARALGLRAAALNAVRVGPEMVSALRDAGLRVAALSVQGRRPAGAELWLPHSPRYVVLAPVYARLAGRPRAHRGPVRSLLVLMGGTDASGSSAALVRALAGRLPRVAKTVVVGPNFARPAELAAALKAAKDPSFRVVRNPRNLPALMAAHDAAATLGSDTSLELACAGTPMLLWEEAPHERRQSRLLASKGCGIFIGSKREASAGKVLAALRRLDDPSRRDKMARACRRFVDGRGAERVASALARLAR